jgi:Rieske Fe-S protein
MAMATQALRTLLLLALAMAIAAACTSDDATSGPSDIFDAGLAESYDRATITTFADGARVATTHLESAGDTALGGELVFHLLRLETGEFVAVHARDPHSDCWTVWDPGANPPGVEATDRTYGWFRDPCHGAVYNIEGARVFGPAPHGLDRHPAEVRDGRLYIDLADAARIPGLPNANSRDPDATPTPVRTPTAPIETRTPTPAAATVWNAGDLLAALETRGIQVQPSGNTVACTPLPEAQVNGLPGTEYVGDTEFVLWVYPSAGAAAQEWVIGEYWAEHPVLQCNRPPARVYPRDNMVLWLPAEPFDPRTIDVADAFLSLGPRPLPSELHGSVIVPPAPGAPLVLAQLLTMLSGIGVPLTPYADLLCSNGESTSDKQLLRYRFPDAPGSGLVLRVWSYPSAAALDEEWRAGIDGSWGAPGVHHLNEPLCGYGPGSLYRNANLMMHAAGSAWADEPTLQATIAESFLALTP